MSKVRVLETTFIGGPQGGTIMLSAGAEYDADDPLVKARPHLFSKPPPEPKAARRPRNG